ncbi:MAG TPA: amidase [Jatrophihabitantaceae bacterium]
MADELMARSALELADLVRTGQVAARTLVETALRRVEELDPTLNALAFVDADRALARADRVRPGDERPFAGVPIVVKDSVAQQGLPCTIGSALFRSYRPTADSATVRRLRDAGFILLGRTTMSELGILPTTESRLTGVTVNPLHSDRTPGGSSGGSAVAVAAGIVPLAHGGDGGGSLRIPAACCGLVGLKPSRGRISSAPQAGDDPLVTEGGLTHTVADTAALLDVLAGYETGDATWAPPPARSFLSGARAGLQTRLRIGLALDPPVPADVHHDYLRAATQTAQLLEQLGHDVQPAVVPPLSEPTRQAFDDVWAVLAAEGVDAGGALLERPATPDDVEPLTWALYEQARSLDALAYRRAQAELQRAAREVVRAASPFDVMVTPALAQPPVPPGTITGWLAPDPLEAIARSDRFSPFTAVWNLTGQPAIVLPLVRDHDGLPLGVQLVGPPAGEALLLAVAAQLEEACQ